MAEAATLAPALNAGADGDPAILAPGREPLTHGGLRALIARLGEDLRAAGVGPRDRVAVVLPNGPEAAIAFLAAASHAAAAPLNPDYTEAEFRFYLGDVGAKALLTAPGGGAAARAAADDGVTRLAAAGEGAALRFEADGAGAAPAGDGAPGPDDTALLLHTSGTTSRPKLAPLTQRNLAASARNIRESLALTPADRCLNVMPLFHVHGLVAAVLASLTSGGSVACAPGFDAFRFLRWLDELEPTWYTAAPTMHQAILQRAERRGAAPARGRLRFLRSSSASLPPSVMAGLEAAFGAPLIEAYGMTEAAHQMTSNPLPPAERKPGGVGVPTGVAVAVLGEDGAPLPPGATGEVAIRGENVTPGYEANPEANAEAFTDDGWFRTGDEGRLDEGGHLFLTGRLKEIINRGGEKVSPREVEEALLAHEAIAQCAAFALPHLRLGEEVAAAVVLAPGASLGEREAREFAAARLAAYKVPRRVVFLDAIPKGATGKLQRIGLAERLGLA